MELADIGTEDAIVECLKKADAKKEAKSFQSGGKMKAKPDLRMYPKPSQQEVILTL